MMVISYGGEVIVIVPVHKNTNPLGSRETYFDTRFYLVSNMRD